MGHECSKQIARRVREPGFVSRYFVGHGIDIGSGSPALGNVDFLGNYRHIFTRMNSVRPWDVEDGDAQLMGGIADGLFDFVHSAHCLEHLRDPVEGLRSWYRILRPGGYMVVVIPDATLYEHGLWPSHFNGDHKHRFTTDCNHFDVGESLRSNSPVEIAALIAALPSPGAQVLKIELLDQTFDYALSQQIDQTGGIAECAIEFVLRKPA